MADMTKELVVSYKIGENEIRLTPSIVQKYLVGDAQITLPEFKMFTELCKEKKLNPFLKEAYCIKYGTSPATIVTSKDVYVARAVANPMYNGKENGIIVQKPDGSIEERQGCFYLPEEKIVGGWCRVYRKDKDKPEYASVSLAEVIGKKKDGSVNSTWSGKTATMVEKVAKVRALREAFIDEFKGMYISEEFGQGNTDEIVAPCENREPLDVTPEDAEETVPEAPEQKTVSLDDL